MEQQRNHFIRTCIIVLGMHRCGTSALARVLNILGATLPHNIIGAGPGNETGHWEPQRLVEFHNEMLSELQSSWDDWRALDLSQLTMQRRQEIKARIAEIINNEYDDVPLMVVKDPRICRFAPLFLQALMDAGIKPECILIVRNALEVAQSLERRNGMPQGEACLLWLRHVLDSEAATRGSRRAILSYDDLLTDWRGELRRITLRAEPGAASCEGGVWPDPGEDAAEQIERFLNPAQRHHVPSTADLIGDPVMSGWIADVHDALQQLRRSPASAAAHSTLDRVRAEFHRAAPGIDRVRRDLLAPLEMKSPKKSRDLERTTRQNFFSILSHAFRAIKRLSHRRLASSDPS